MCNRRQISVECDAVLVVGRVRDNQVDAFVVEVPIEEVVSLNFPVGSIVTAIQPLVASPVGQSTCFS